MERRKAALVLVELGVCVRADGESKEGDGSDFETENAECAAEAGSWAICDGVHRRKRPGADDFLAGQGAGAALERRDGVEGGSDV